MLQIVLDPERTWWSAIDHGAGKLSKRAAGMMKARGVKRGIPDVIIMFADGLTDHAHLIGIELKFGKGRRSEVQEDVAATWAIFGNAVFVARSLEEVQEILEFCHVPMRRRMTIFGGSHEGIAPRRPASPRHRRARHPRQSKGALPVVQRRPQAP
jgi:hypothetical protein